MKLDGQISQDQIKVEGQAEVKKAPVALGQLQLHKGQIMWDLDMKSGFISPAEYETVANIKGGVHKKLLVKDHHLYAPAINIKNAEKKFLKML